MQKKLTNIFTARVAKRARVMFSQAFVCPSPGHNTSLPPPDQVTTPPPGPGHNISLPQGPGHNTSLPPGPGHNKSLPPPGPGHNTPLPPGLCAGWRYASYWSAFLFTFILLRGFNFVNENKKASQYRPYKLQSPSPDATPRWVLKWTS